MRISIGIGHPFEARGHDKTGSLYQTGFYAMRGGVRVDGGYNQVHWVAC